MTTIAVIDHGAGNLVSIVRGLERGGATAITVDSAAGRRLENGGFDGVVLPGVGATAAAMERLDGTGLSSALREWPGPLLGICVGLQLLFDGSDEHGGGDCLGLIPGRVRRLEHAPLLPHIGWNDVALTDHPLFTGIAGGTPFYFVHSYAPVPDDQATVIGRTDYGTEFAAAVADGGRVGVQFHPERSGAAGLAVLANFVAVCAEQSRAA